MRLLSLIAPTLVLLLGLLLPRPATAAVLPAEVFAAGGYLVSHNEQVILAQNPAGLLIPASTWKLATALMALEQLGPDFRYQTHFHLAGKQLYIKGFGDPGLVSEEVVAIAGQLAGRGLREIGDLVMDDSFFQLEQPGPDGSGGSMRPYDAANGALAVNFNTIKIEVQADGRVISAEPQTPTLPIMQTMAADRPAGIHRLNVSQDRERSRRYSGELFKHLLAEHGIVVHGEIRAGLTPADAPLLYRHQSSRTLADTVREMLLYSNNFIANQLYLTCGAQAAGAPATWEKGRLGLEDFLDRIGLAPGSFIVAEGSGLSRDNRISPASLGLVLERFRPYAELLPFWQGRLVKSGTLQGVYAYAGFFRRDRELDPFVVILNQPANTRDRALELLEEQWLRIQATAGFKPDSGPGH